tara:strand:+ start:283 stop:549 length:267 start_codon:yes stop_codon:yes gene_type:complete
MSDTSKDLLLQMEEKNPEALYPTGFEDAITEIVYKDGNPVFKISTQACIGVLQKRDGMSFEDAVEFFEYNIHGSYMGRHNPVYAHDLI